MLCADLGGCCVSWKNDTDIWSCSNIHPIAPYRCYCDEQCWKTNSCCYDYEEFCEWDICKTEPCENGATCAVDEDGWSRVAGADFLTQTEKRALLGLPPLADEERGDE